VLDKLLIAKQSRKQGLLEVCKRYLIEAEQLITSSDEEGLGGISLQKEKYILIQEKIKLIRCHFGNNYVRLNLKAEEFARIRKQLIKRGLDISSPQVLEDMKLAELKSIKDRENSKDQDNNSPNDSEKVYRDIWESEIYRLRGKLLLDAQKYVKAND
jgi:hypothetical protein